MEEDHIHSGSGGTSEWFKEANRHVTLKFDDIVYKVKLPPPSKSSNWPAYKKSSAKSEEEKTILNGVSGTVYPGEMLAMLGPSGSGKTTLLTALGGKFGGGGNNGKLNGTVTYNGAPFSSQIRRTTGFVTQDDVLYPQLTVTESLVYTALLRLPNSLTRKEKVAHAEGRGSVMGGENLRGISGGERKRVSIGQVSVWNV